MARLGDVSGNLSNLVVGLLPCVTRGPGVGNTAPGSSRQLCISNTTSITKTSRTGDGPTVHPLLDILVTPQTPMMPHNIAEDSL